MKFQKILSLVTLVIAALATVLALFFCSGVLAAIINYSVKDVASQTPEWEINAQPLYDYSQKMNNVLVIMGIVLILTVALMYLMGNSKRRNYYVTNIVSTGIYVLYAVTFAIVFIVACIGCFVRLGNVDVAEWKRYEAELSPTTGRPLHNQYYDYNYSTLVLGILMGVVLLATAAAWVLNLLWKIKLMKGEKQLLEQGAIANKSDMEVA